ncbi:hypothetical protein OO013_20000 [Mangrovivirga sp. M17]|uniref:Uncharacterized protein n=1 Tax=Mangrovivirga halotolerans TaxID=2993936 RepID=A0ABT3RX64_9BACT|nr:hypothetical protein [Mangrovivirga halotolerans]MCX2746172.1 hypothetical protein [Mangrovivirga halotolerans]
MIIATEIINQPYSGQYEERVYDIESPWNSQLWTWVKFIMDNGTEWVGNFRGEPHGVAISNKFNSCIVLTSDYLFLLDLKNGELIESDRNHTFTYLTTSPFGDYIIIDFYKIEKITDGLNNIIKIESPIEMDIIEVKGWNGNLLEFSCVELGVYDKEYFMQFDSETEEIKKITIHNNT